MRIGMGQRKWLKWVGASLASLALFLGIASYWWGAYWCSKHFCGYVQCGEAALAYHYPFDAGWWGIERNMQCQTYISLLNYQPRSWYVSTPLWLIVMALGLPTFFAFWRDRQPPPGHCKHCRYYLMGNLSGVCPECGRAVADKP